MRVEERQHARLAHLAQLVAAQVDELLLVDHLEAAIDEGLVVALHLDGDLALHQQVHLAQLAHEVLGALAGLLELLAERQNALGQLRRLGAVEQAIAVLERADHVARRVEAQRQLVRIRAQLREHEGVTADIGGDVEGLLGQLARLVDEHVDAVVQAHQGERDRVVADREDDRHVALDHRELLHGDRDRVLGGEVGRPCLHADAIVGMDLARERLQAVVEERKLRRAGHWWNSGVTCVDARPPARRKARTPMARGRRAQAACPG